MRGLDRSLAIALLRAREQVMSRFRPLLAAEKLTDQQWRVLRVLKEEDSLDATELAQRSVIRTPSITRILRALEQRGLIARHKTVADGRRWSIALTEAGHGVFDRIAPQSEATYRAIESQFGKGNLSELMAHLGRLGALD